MTSPERKKSPAESGTFGDQQLLAEIAAQDMAVKQDGRWAPVLRLGEELDWGRLEIAPEEDQDEND